MKKYGFSIFSLAFALMMVLSSCKTKNAASSSKTKSNQPAILVFPGYETVYQDEFEYVYQKNNGGWDDVKGHSQEEYREYLDLYINFKRKVLEAEANGLHETESFKNEFEGYRKQLAQPYLVDKSVQESLVQEAFDRSKVVVSAYHILVMCAPDASPNDTMKAFQKISGIRDSIVSKGMAFDAAATKFSEDPSAKSNQGALGYFSVFDMVYPFETGAFNTKVGEVSPPVRTGYGYHLIKVTDRMESSGKKTAAHIIVRVGPQYSAKTDQEADARINEIHKELKGGADWREMVRKYSDDPNTNEKGGDLGKGRLIPEMEDFKRNLNADEFSEPFKTSFGFHIMKVTEVEAVKTFEEAKSQIKSRIARDARSTLSKERLITKVKRENNFKENKDNIAKFVAFIDEQGQAGQYVKGFWRPVDSTMQFINPLVVYTIGSGDTYHEGTVADYVAYYLKNKKGVDGANASQATERFIKTFFEGEALSFEERQLPQKYREYRELIKEYRDGILLFTLTEDKVWRKAVEDTTGLKNYYEGHKSDFMAGERIVLDEYITDNQNTIDRVASMLKSGKSEEEITKELNAASALNLTVRTQTYEKGKSDVIDPIFSQKAGYQSEIDSYGNNRFRIFVLKEHLVAGQKSFDDAKSECITKYQNHLEAEWLKELKEKYPVTIMEPVLLNLFKN